MKHFIFFIILLCSINLIGQTVFNKRYETPEYSTSNAVIQRFDSNFLMIGSGRVGSDSDIQLVLVNPLGEKLWETKIGHPNYDEIGISVIETQDQNYLITGRKQNKPYIIKVDQNGALLWEREYPNALSNIARSIKQSSDGNYYFICSELEISLSSTLYKINPLGDVLWSIDYLDKSIQSLIVTNDDGIGIIGYVEDSFGLTDLHVLKLDSNGNEQWSNTFGGEGRDYGNSIQQLSNGDYLLLGSYDKLEVDVGYYTFMIRVDSSGNEIWSNTDHYTHEISHFEILENENEFIVASFEAYLSDIPPWYEKFYYLHIHKFSVDGEYICRAAQGDAYSYNRSHNIIETLDGGYLMTGYSRYDWQPDGHPKIRLVKYDNNCNTVLGFNDFELNEISVSVFPNPTSSNLTFQLKSSSNINITEISIFNTLGQNIKQLNSLNNSSQELILKDFSSGLYYYTLLLSDGNTIKGTFIFK